MPVDLNFFKSLLPGVLEGNPNVRNSALSGVIAANIVNFKGHIQVSESRVHSFKSDGYEGIRKPAKIIYISPYGFWLDILVSIKRIFTGIVFAPSKANRDLRSDLCEGRRVTIFCTLDGSEAEALIEVDQKPLFVRLYKTAFSCCH